MVTKTPSAKEKGAIKALKFILPIIKKHSLRFVITGGFACYVYGVKRKLTDIDIDIDKGKDSKEFQDFLADIANYVTQPIEHFVDQNYDNYNIEISIDGQVIDICPMAELKIFNKENGKYEAFYSRFPKIEKAKFFGIELPLLSKDLIIKNKEMLVWQRQSDKQDIKDLREIKKRFKH